MTQVRRGTLYCAGAYLLWGLFPLYWPLLAPAGAIEVLSHRIVWSLAVVAALLVVGARSTSLRPLLADRRRLALLTAAACVISVNWGCYIWGVTNGRVVETSLGYFINPIVTVLLGVVVLGERLRRAQWAALGMAALAVLVLTVEAGHPPYLALALAFSFGTYALLKKSASVGAVEGLAVETAVLTPVALGYLVLLGAHGSGTFTSQGAGHALLLAGAGVVTAVPLLLFGGAATRVPMTTLGVMQYLAPTIQFLLGITIFDEPLPLPTLLGFALVWAGLVLFTADLVRHRRRTQRAGVPVAIPVG